MTSLPRVWGDGTATIAVGPDGLSLWVGQVRVEFVRTLTLNCLAMEDGSSKVDLQLSFHHSWDPPVAEDIERNVRLARTVPWVRIA